LSAFAGSNDRMTDRITQPRIPPRTLAGATILQIVPALREEPVARTALNVAHMLLQAGARTMIAGAGGPLAAELKAYGGEWVALKSESLNPFTLRRNAGILEKLIGAERVDIIHAQSVGGAWSARRAASRATVWLVTTLPDVPPATSRAFGAAVGDLARGDRIIAPSNYAATPVMQKLSIPREQITIVPRAIDTDQFDPGNVGSDRPDRLRAAWRIAPGQRVALAPGRVAPWNGQLLLPDVARVLHENGYRDLVFVLVGENRKHRRYARSVLAHAKELGVEGMFRIVGHCPDMPAVFAIADVVIVPALEAPVLGRVVAQAQAMGRPVVTSDVGVLPEHVVAPPLMPEDLRTGWVAAKGDPIDFARALSLALTLEEADYRAMSARAREFAEYMFSPSSVAVATRAVYISLLARDH
jgi:glycosyltransferase involved in cell wall biosynthesis